MNNLILALRQVALVGFVAFVLTRGASADSPPLWGKLSPGTFAVGYKSLWQLDCSRRYNMTFNDKTAYALDKAPRPILINVWYPATKVGDPKKMLHRDYLEIPSADARLAKYSTKLTEYNRAVIAQEIVGKPTKDLSDRERRLLDQFLDTPTACARNAPPIDEKFPLVIYHSGHGSSFEDNSVLCEFLASHGYVVFGSAFQKPDGSSFGVDGGETSASDMEFLIAYGRQQSNVDWNHIGVVGHSGGAHAALTFRARNNCAADAVVSLDTTQDYYSLADPRWEPLTTTVIKNSNNMTGPLLMVANPHAFFQMADSLSFARRSYLTIKDLGHNDFISQGRIGKDIRFRCRSSNPVPARPDSNVGETAKEKADLEAVKTGYESLCVYILRFLNAELKGEAASKEFVANQYRDTKFGDAAPHVEFVPEGRTGPEAYSESRSLSPTPRQLRYFLREQGSDKTVAMLRRLRSESPTQPIHHHVFGLALVGELLEQGKTRDATIFNDYFRESGVDCGKALLEWGKVYMRLDSKSLAADCFKKVLLLDPSNSEAASKLKDLGEPKKGN